MNYKIKSKVIRKYHLSEFFLYHCTKFNIDKKLFNKLIINYCSSNENELFVINYLITNKLLAKFNFTEFFKLAKTKDEQSDSQL